jgi:hypothetical protein
LSIQSWTKAPGAAGLLDDRLDRLGLVGIGDLDLHIVDRGVAAEEQLGLGQRHVDEALVELAHADAEDAADRVVLLARRGAERRGRAGGRDQGDGVADRQAEVAGHAVADQHDVAAVLALAEAGQRAALDVGRDHLHAAQVGRGDAAHDGAGHLAGADDHGLGLDHRRGLGHAAHGLDAADDAVAVGSVQQRPLGVDVAVEAQQPAQQLGAEAVHHAHHGDQGEDRQHHRRERDDGDQRHAAVLALVAQVPPGDGALPGSERTGAERPSGGLA